MTQFGIILSAVTVKSGSTQWISLLYRRVQKIEQINKNAIEWHWSPTSELVGTLVKFH